MKKILSGITILLYVVMSCGVMINLHYCMGRFQSFDLYSVEKNDCSKCGMPMNKAHGCCKDEVKIVKLQDDQNKSTVSYEIKNVETPVIIPSGFIAAFVINPNIWLQQEVHSPPLLTGQDACLLHCVFRI